MILVAGGSGTLGKRLVPRLAERGLHVRILSRDPKNVQPAVSGSVDIMSGDVRNARAVDQAVAGARTVISAITGFGMARDVSPVSVDWHGNRNLIRAAKAAGVEHFILLSICQAAADHPIELFRMKHLAEEELRASGLAWTIIRPTAYMETWLGILGEPLLRTGTTRVFGRGQNPINFVATDDVARLVDLAVVEPTMMGVTVEVGGPENLTMVRLVETFQALTGARGKVSHIPLPMMRVMSILMNPINPAMAGLIKAAVVMDTRDMSFDPSKTQGRYPSISPTPLAAVVAREYAPRSAAAPA
jgi:uncharacterized protein YbjT (DUF2867 family)